MLFSKECPVSKGDVSDGNVIPIYENGGGQSGCEMVSGLKLPPLPKSRRAERVGSRIVLCACVSHVALLL